MVLAHRGCWHDNLRPCIVFIVTSRRRLTSIQHRSDVHVPTAGNVWERSLENDKSEGNSTWKKGVRDFFSTYPSDKSRQMSYTKNEWVDWIGTCYARLFYKHLLFLIEPLKVSKSSLRYVYNMLIIFAQWNSIPLPSFILKNEAQSMLSKCINFWPLLSLLCL